MKKFIFTSCLLLLSISLFAQSNEVLNMARKISAENIKKDLFQLSSEEMEGRETATHGQKLAAQYIYKQFKEASINSWKNNQDSLAYFQQFPVYQTNIPAATIKYGNNEFVNLKDFMISGYTDMEMKNMKIHFIGNAADSCFMGKNFKNEAVVFLTSNLYAGFSKCNDILKETGAKCIFFCNPDNPHQLQKIINTQKYIRGGRLTLDPDLFKRKLPFDSVQNPRAYKQYKLATSTYIGPLESKVATTLFNIKTKNLRKHLSGNKPKLNYKSVEEIDISFSQKYDEKFTENVVALIPGSEIADEYIVLTAHYDHMGKNGDKIFYGANDNASGTAALIEIARTFKKAQKAGIKFKRNILFVACSAEEKGLLGSRYFVEQCGIPPHKIKANLNLDMLGRKDQKHENPNYSYLLGASDLNPKLKLITDSINAVYPNIELDYSYDYKNNFLYAASDQASFVDKNIPAIFYFNGLHDDYHKTTDTADKVDCDAISKVAALVFLTAVEIANGD